MVNLDSGVRRFDTVFVVALLTLFAITASLLVLISAKQYNITTQEVNNNYETRTISSYLREKIRQSDANNAISIQDLNGTQAIAMVQVLDSGNYYTYIYAYEGYLYESYQKEGVNFVPTTGQKIMPIDSMKASITDRNILQVEYATTQKETRRVDVNLMSAEGGASDE